MCGYTCGQSGVQTIEKERIRRLEFNRKYEMNVIKMIQNQSMKTMFTSTVKFPIFPNTIVRVQTLYNILWRVLGNLAAENYASATQRTTPRPGQQWRFVSNRIAQVKACAHHAHATRQLNSPLDKRPSVRASVPREYIISVFIVLCEALRSGFGIRTFTGHAHAHTHAHSIHICENVDLKFKESRHGSNRKRVLMSARAPMRSINVRWWCAWVTFDGGNWCKRFILIS